jgi:hypothetical protein
MDIFLSGSLWKVGLLRSASKFCLTLSNISSGRTVSRTTKSQCYNQKAEQKMEDLPDYKRWSHERLVDRVTQLEQELKKKDLRLHICHSFCESPLMQF